jgi:hypothetical protein
VSDGKLQAELQSDLNKIFLGCAEQLLGQVMDEYASHETFKGSSQFFPWEDYRVDR